MILRIEIVTEYFSDHRTVSRNGCFKFFILTEPKGLDCNTKCRMEKLMSFKDTSICFRNSAT